MNLQHKINPFFLSLTAIIFAFSEIQSTWDKNLVKQKRCQL